MPQMSKESASQIAVEYLKKEKNTDNINIAVVEEQKDGWIVRGTCPIDLEGHPWVEKFAIIVNRKGRIEGMNYGLL